MGDDAKRQLEQRWERANKLLAELAGKTKIDPVVEDELLAELDHVEYELGVRQLRDRERRS